MTFLNNDLNPRRRKFKKCFQKTFSAKTVKRILPMTEWLPKYNSTFFIQDVIAGITVGLMAIPQGIAYAVIAGLPPEHGLYASLTSGVVYVFFGSCKDVTVGPTAILAAMTAKYVANYSIDFAILAAFLSGIFILILGILQLGFLVNFISTPVISGFTTAAALQIAASQLKSLFGLAGDSGNSYAGSIYNFIHNIKTANLWEMMLSFGSIIMLVLLKRMGEGCKRSDGIIKRMRWFISLARNAVVVIIGMIVTFTIKITLNTEPLAIVGDIGGGLPEFTLPPFSTVVGNQTYSFGDMLGVLGYSSVLLPFVAILESVAIAKAFADGSRVDVTQEMIALGLCNVIGSFGQSMPITGSFGRTALNHVSGVKTQAGGITKVILIIVALTSLTSTFYYIPKASLAALIVTAMFSMLDHDIFKRLWRNSKREFIILQITTTVCLTYGLEYGIIVGILIEAAFLLYNTSRPSVDFTILRNDKEDLLIVPLSDSVSYCAAEYLRKAVLKASLLTDHTTIVVDGTNLKNMDFTVAASLMSIGKEIEKRPERIFFLNFNLNLKNLCIDIEPKAEDKFVYAARALDLTETNFKYV